MGNRQCYKLTGVIIHVPNMEADGRHYTRYFQSRNQNQWFYADDTQVSFFNNIFPIIDYYLCMYMYMCVSTCIKLHIHVYTTTFSTSLLGYSGQYWKASSARPFLVAL